MKTLDPSKQKKTETTKHDRTSDTGGAPGKRADQRLGAAEGELTLPESIAADDDAVAEMFRSADPAECTANTRGTQIADTGAVTRARFLAELVSIVKDAIPKEKAAGANFDAARWVSAWITSPLPALGGASPLEYLATDEQRAVVKRLLNNTINGDYA